MEKRPSSVEIRSAPAKGGGAAVVRAAFLSLFGLALLAIVQSGFGSARGLLSKLADAVPDASCHVKTPAVGTAACPVRQRRLLRDTRPRGWNPPLTADLDDRCRCAPGGPASAGGTAYGLGPLPATRFSLERPEKAVFNRFRTFSIADSDRTPGTPRAPPADFFSTSRFI